MAVRCTAFNLRTTAIILLICGFVSTVIGSAMIGCCWIAASSGCRSELITFWVLLWLGLSAVIIGMGCLAMARRVTRLNQLGFREIQPEVNYLVPEARGGATTMTPSRVLRPPPAYDNFAYEYPPNDTSNSNHSVNPSEMLFEPPPSYDQISKP